MESLTPSVIQNSHLSSPIKVTLQAPNPNPCFHQNLLGFANLTLPYTLYCAFYKIYLKSPREPNWPCFLVAKDGMYEDAYKRGQFSAFLLGCSAARQCNMSSASYSGSQEALVALPRLLAVVYWGELATGWELANDQVKGILRLLSAMYGSAPSVYLDESFKESTHSQISHH